mmetsp:Transcript_5264/g.11949  ORF Transcript_5264/g.11949 Transcript_5264/m.11949 type:complete len:271 (-) Transcript_5264:141-953(-)
MESAIINLHTCFVPPRRPLLVNHKFVIQAEFTLGHPGELGVHLNSPRHLTSKDASGGRNQQIDRFQDVDINLSLFIPQPLPPPINRTCNLLRQLLRLRLVLRLDIPQINVESQHIHSAILGIPKVHRLIHQLINQCHIIPHGVLIKIFAEVGFEDTNFLKEIFKHEGGVDIRLCQCDEVHVQMAGVEERAVFNALDGGLGARLLGGDDLEPEGVRRDAAYVVAILTGDHYLPLLVEDHYHGDHFRLLFFTPSAAQSKRGKSLTKSVRCVS